MASIPMLSDFNAGGVTKITDLATAVNPGDSISFGQVESLIAAAEIGIYKSPVLAATTEALPANTYAAGTAGVGATLTATANGVLTIDGKSDFAVGDRVLIKNEATAANNGIYTVTVVGSTSAAYKLTRATDFDTSAKMEDGSHIIVTQGSTLEGSVWMLAAAVAVVGTDAVGFIPQSVVVAGVATSVTNGNQVNVLVDGVTIQVNGDNKLESVNDATGSKAVPFVSGDWSTDTLTLSAATIGLGTDEIGAHFVNASGQLISLSWVTANDGSLVATKASGVSALGGKALCSAYAA